MAARAAAVGDDHVAACGSGDGCGLELGDHAAGALIGGAAPGQGENFVIQLFNDGNEGGVGVLVGVGGVEAVDIRQQDQQICPDALGHVGRQGVVVADDDLLGGHGVIFVDDGQDAQFQQTVQGVAEIEVTDFVCDVLPGDQQLGHGVVVLAEELIISIHQFALAHGGGGLLGGDVGGTLAQAQLAHAHADGAGGHQDHLMTRILDVADDLAQLLHQPDVQMSGRVGQGAGADLDDDAHSDSSISHYFTAL